MAWWYLPWWRGDTKEEQLWSPAGKTGSVELPRESRNIKGKLSCNKYPNPLSSFLQENLCTAVAEDQKASLFSQTHFPLGDVSHHGGQWGGKPCSCSFNNYSGSCVDKWPFPQQPIAQLEQVGLFEDNIKKHWMLRIFHYSFSLIVSPILPSSPSEHWWGGVGRSPLSKSNTHLLSVLGEMNRNNSS